MPAGVAGESELDAPLVGQFEKNRIDKVNDRSLAGTTPKTAMRRVVSPLRHQIGLLLCSLVRYGGAVSSRRHGLGYRDQGDPASSQLRSTAEIIISSLMHWATMYNISA
jgi:hypothetical protein